MKFDLKRPCKDCPFLRGTTMVLRPGRMEGIVRHLKDDHNVFPCHKTTQHDEDSDGEPITVPHEHEQACMGALAFTLAHHKNLPVLARIAVATRRLRISDIRVSSQKLEEPGKWKTE